MSSTNPNYILSYIICSALFHNGYREMLRIGIIIGKQLALSLDMWSVPTIGSVIGYSCVWTMVGCL